MPRRVLRNADLLGDGSDSDSVDEFQSPEEDAEQTNYGLEYTSAPVGRVSTRPLTSLNAGNTAEVSSTPRENTARRGRRSLQVGKRTPAPTQPTGSQRRKTRPPVRQNLRALQEIRHLQKSTKILIPRLPFARLVKEILMDLRTEVTHITKFALDALQESTEVYVTYQLQDAYTLTLHRGRVTLSVKDMELLRYLRGPT